MKAVIRGDWHASKHDSRALFDREQNEIDVLYIEGRGDIIDIEDRGAPYVLFLIGYFSLELLYSFVSWAYRYLPLAGISSRCQSLSVSPCLDKFYPYMDARLPSHGERWFRRCDR